MQENNNPKGVTKEEMQQWLKDARIYFDNYDEKEARTYYDSLTAAQARIKELEADNKEFKLIVDESDRENKEMNLLVAKLDARLVEQQAKIEKLMGLLEREATRYWHFDYKDQKWQQYKINNGL